MAVPPPGSSRATARLADSLVSGSATARLPSDGKTGCALSVPEITAKATPSRITSTAAAVAWRASAILVRGALIDPEQSIMMISAEPSPLVGPALADPAPAESEDVTVTTALTSRPPSGMYSFWKMSTVKSGWLIAAILLGSALRVPSPLAVLRGGLGPWVRGSPQGSAASPLAGLQGGLGPWWVRESPPGKYCVPPDWPAGLRWVRRAGRAGMGQ